MTEKYTHVLYMSDHPELEAVYTMWLTSNMRYGRRTWSYLFKTDKYYHQLEKRKEWLNEIQKMMYNIVGHHVDFLVVPSHEPNDYGGVGQRKMVLYREHVNA